MCVFSHYFNNKKYIKKKDVLNLDKFENKENNREEEKEQYLVIPFNKKTLKYTLLIITFAFLLFLIATNPEKTIEMIENVIALFSPFLIGLCFAFVINTILMPFEKFWDKLPSKRCKRIKNKLKRPVCLAVSTIIIIGVVFAIFFMLVPELINTGASLIKMLPDFVKNLNIWWNEKKVMLENYNIVLPNLNFDSNRMLEAGNSLISNYGEKFINTTVNITTIIISFIVNIILAIVFSIYLLSQKEKLGRQTKKVLFTVFRNDKVKKFLDVVSLSNQSFSRFVVGQLLEAVIIGFLCFIGMLIFRMPYAGVISILVGFTALIPVFGAFIGTAIGAFLILLVSPIKAFWFVVFIIILQQIEGNLIYPKVVGKSVGLPGIWVLVAVTVGGGAFGILGMLFSVPVCSILYVLLKEYITKKNTQHTKNT